MTQSDDLDESLRHPEYEMAMMVASPRILAKHQLTPAQNTARPDGYYWANDRAVAYLAAMESARLPTKTLKANDRYAAEYCATNGWKGFAVLTPDQHRTINQQVSHLITQRRPRKPHEIGRFAQRAVDALIVLTRRADPEWQDRLEDILAKVAAEQRRIDDAWNPVDLA